MSGFVDLTLESGASITVSKTAVFYLQESKNSPQTTLLHCGGSVTHQVKGGYEEISVKFPNFIQTELSDGVKVGIHDYNVSYLEEKQNGIQVHGVAVYFTSGPIGLDVKENYSDFKKKFHQI
ncbi:hypothetical protein ACFQ02_00295 [Seminibacterium arietis]|uniref:Uncharacterized protein n=1 Tax=Seminibacterium arietis TaxID=1173502 RepID=A0ABW3I5W8_9PAST